MLTRGKRLFSVIAGLAGCVLAAERASGTTITAADLDYGVSGKGSNAFGLDLSADTNWGAGAQRSNNGSVDAANFRAGRFFVDFLLDAPTIAAANQPGASVVLKYTIDLIGQGVSGKPYTDGLDLRYEGVAATDRDASTLWNTAGVGADQSDIVATNGSTGTYNTTVTNSSVLSTIAAATPGQYSTFCFTNSAGVGSSPSMGVGNSLSELYAFQMNHTISEYTLSVVPEPGSIGLVSVAGGMLLSLRRRRATV